ncbi:diguanylate cyclase domain-containing protein [Methylobacterium sp. M6A4_1b]
MFARFLHRCIRSPRTWIGLGILVPVGMVAVCSVMLLQLRRDAWDKAEQTAKNLLTVIERDIDRNIEIIDRALESLVENLTMYDLEELSPKFRQRILFDGAVNARDLNALLVLDQYGNCIYDAAGWPARSFNNADRAYFKAHQANPDLGLGISQPMMSRSVGKPVVVLSRRTGLPGGSFSGIVLGSLSLSYFDRLFAHLELGQAGTINLFLGDGTRIVRYPEPDPGAPPNFANAPNFLRFQREGRGSFVAATQTDGIERLYSFTRVGTLPLILNVALSTREIEAEWRSRALVIGTLVLALCGITVGLSLLVAWELERRNAAEAELADESRTDALTGLPNRRAFEEAFERAWADARRRRAPLALLVIDADHFKGYNDRYGHAGGDRVLRALAGAFSACAQRPGDLVARVGGEEFTHLLADIDPEDAAQLAEQVHAAVARLVVAANGTDVGRITVSIGLAFALPRLGGSPADLFRLADAALYAAKAMGRNRTCYAVMGMDGAEIFRSSPQLDIEPVPTTVRSDVVPLVA